MSEKVLTAPLAVIKVIAADGTATTIGKIKNLRVSETFQRGDVKGIGQLVATEKPILAINCTFTASSYFIDIRKLGNISNPFLRRGVNQTLSSFVDTILLTDAGVNLYLYKKIKGPDDQSATNGGIVTQTAEEPMGIIKNAFLDSQSFDISEGQIAGQDLSGTYLEPILL